MPYPLDEAIKSLKAHALSSPLWQSEVLEKLQTDDQRQEAERWLYAINESLATAGTGWLKLGEKEYLFPYTFDAIRGCVLSKQVLSPQNIASFVTQFRAVKAELDEKRPVEKWEEHLEEGDISFHTKATGFKDTLVWENQAARRLLFEIARMAAQPPHKISLGKQSSIKEALVNCVLAVVNDEAYEDTDENRTLYATAILEKEVLKPDAEESGRLAQGHQFDLIPEAAPLYNRWSVRWMNEKEVALALPRTSNESIEILAPYDSVSGFRSQFRRIFAPYLHNAINQPEIQHIFLPVCSHSHWQAVYIKKREAKALHITVFDSFGESAALRDLKPEIEQLLRLAFDGDREMSWVFEGFNVPYRQKGGDACGYYVVAFAHYVMKKLGFNKSESPYADGYDEAVADSLNKSQRAIEQTVTRLHDARFNGGEAPNFEESSPSASMPSTSPLNHNSFFKHTPNTSKLVPLKGHVGKALNLKVRLMHKPKDPLLERPDIKAVKTQICSLTKRSSRFFNFGYKTKAEKLRRAYFGYIKRKEEGESVAHLITEDKAVSEAIDSYRYFGLFYTLLEKAIGYKKKTGTRIEIDKASSKKPAL